jgi:hypothetical protein
MKERVEKEKFVYVLLMGGLGNQLFQLSAGLFYGKEKVRLVSNLSHNVRTKLNTPEVLDLKLPSRCEGYEFEEIGYLVRKLVNYSIRLSTKKRSAQHTFFEVFLAMCFSIRQRRKFSVYISDGVGFTENFRGKSDHTLLIGYFQSWRYAECLAKAFGGSQIRLKNPSKSFEESLQFFESKSWRLVHIRLGDYLLSDDFGVLSPEYFIKQISVQEEFKRLETFVFTNDETSLKGMSSELYGLLPELTLSLSSAELLLLWTSATQFVISNSTFSWWSAYLSGRGGVDVIAPEPWFKVIQTPDLLVSPKWKRVAPSFVERSN